MTAQEFLESSLEGSKLTAFQIEKTEQYRELWTTNEHPKLDGYGLLHLLSGLQSKGFIFKFTSMDTIKIQTPCFKRHMMEEQHYANLKDGWSCDIDLIHPNSKG